MELSYLSSSDRKIKLRWNDAFNMPLLCLLYPCDLGGSHAAIVSQPLEFIYDFNDVRTSWSRLVFGMSSAALGGSEDVEQSVATEPPI